MIGMSSSAFIAGDSDEVYVQDLSRRLELQLARTAPAWIGEACARLAVVAGPDSGRVFALSAETTSVGRDCSNRIVLTDPSASRYHAEIRRRGRQFELMDIGSGNGTQHNGRRLRDPAVLRDGDEIAFGETFAIFACSAARRDARETLPGPAKLPVRVIALLAGIALLLLAAVTVLAS